MEITSFTDFVFEEEDFTKEDLFALIEEYDEEDLEEMVEFIIDLFEDEEGDDAEAAEETNFTPKEVIALIETLGEDKLKDIIEYAIMLAGDGESAEEDELEEKMSTAAKTRASVKRKKPAHKKAMRKLAKCRKAHKNLPDNKACGTDGKLHTKRSKTKRKKTRVKRKRLSKRITVK